MIGFVGAQARRRRRNKIILVSLAILIFIFIFYLPTLDFPNEGESSCPSGFNPKSSGRLLKKIQPGITIRAIVVRAKKA